MRWVSPDFWQNASRFWRYDELRHVGCSWFHKAPPPGSCDIALFTDVLSPESSFSRVFEVPFSHHLLMHSIAHHCLERGPLASPRYCSKVDCKSCTTACWHVLIFTSLQGREVWENKCKIFSGFSTHRKSQIPTLIEVSRLKLWNQCFVWAPWW